MMVIDDANVALRFFGIVFTVFVWFYAWRVKRAQASQTQIDTLGNRASGLELKLVSFEARLESAPDRESIHALAINMEKLNGKLEVSNARYAAVEALLNRVETMTNRQEHHLLKRGKP